MQKQTLEQWLASKEERLGLLQRAVESELSESLDFTPGSLDVLQRFLLHRFSKIQELWDPNQAEILDSASTYLGEVHIRNHPLQLRWEKNGPRWDEDGEFQFGFWVGGENGYTGFSPYRNKVISTVHKRKDNMLSGHFEKSKAYYLAEEEARLNTPANP